MSQESNSHAQETDLPEGFDPAKPLRDPSREAFAQELAAGESLYDAYETAGFSRPRGNAQRMMREPEVAARLGWLLERVAALDEVMIAYRRHEQRRALEHIANADRLALFEEKTGYQTVGKKRRRYRTLALKPLDKLSADERALIDGIELTDKGGIKVHMPKRLDARAQLAKLDGLDKPAKVAPTDAAGTGPAVLEVRWKESEAA